MPVIKKIKIRKSCILALELKLLGKKLIVFRGSKGYIMCGYLNLKAAERFGDSAIKITGVSTIEEGLKAKVYSCTHRAKKMGIYKGQPVRDVLRIIV